MSPLTLVAAAADADLCGMTRKHRTGDLHTASSLRHPDNLWNALAAALRDADDDPTESRRRLAALRLHQPTTCC